MTKREENQPNLSFSFKIKLTKKKNPVQKIESSGLYKQMKSGNRVSYNKTSFSMQDIQAAMSQVFIKDPTRTVKIVTNRAGAEMFEEALKKEFEKTKYKDEHRKKIDFRSEVFKQT